MSKFYAVKHGRKNGIYNTWSECKVQVDGFPNAIFKSFPTYEEAEKFLGKINENILQEESTSEIEAYIDGSYDDIKKLYSYAGIVFLPNRERIEFSYADSDSRLINLRNVAGELKAAMHVIDLAIKNQANSIDIYYDYAGIENWANKTWMAKNEFTQKYVEYIDSVKSRINISFKKVKSHSGNKYNEEVDLLAKNAITNYVNNKSFEVTGDNNDSKYDIYFKDLDPTKKSINVNLLIDNNLYKSDDLYIKLKAKWKSQGRMLKEIVGIKTILDANKKKFILNICTEKNEEVLVEIDLKELK